MGSIYQFPSQQVIEECLDNHSLTSYNQKEWQVHKAVAQLFADKLTDETSVVLSVTLLLNGVLKKQIPLSSFFRSDMGKNIVLVLKTCAEKKSIIGESKLLVPEGT